VKFDISELRIDTWRGPDGATPCIRITHLPTGKTVVVDDQPDNNSRERALELLSKALEPGS